MAWTTFGETARAANSPIAQSPNCKRALAQPNSLIEKAAPTIGQLGGDKKISPITADKVIDSVSDLVTPAYKPKYYKALYVIGPAAFDSLAARARNGKYPPHLFRTLIDNAVKAAQ